MKITMTIEAEVESFEEFRKRLQDNVKKNMPMVVKTTPSISKEQPKPLDESKIPKWSKFKWKQYLPDNKDAQEFVYEQMKLGKTEQQITDLMIGYVKDKNKDVDVVFLTGRIKSTLGNVRNAIKNGRTIMKTTLENGEASIMEVGNIEEETDEEKVDNDLGGNVE